MLAHSNKMVLNTSLNDVSEKKLYTCRELEVLPVVQHLFDLSKKLDLELSEFTRSSSIISEFFQEQNLNLIMIGSYSLLILFLKELSSIDQLLYLQNFEINKLERKSGQSLLEIKLGLKLYCIGA